MRILQILSYFMFLFHKDSESSTCQNSGPKYILLLYASSG